MKKERKKDEMIQFIYFQGRVPTNTLFLYYKDWQILFYFWDKLQAYAITSTFYSNRKKYIIDNWGVLFYLTVKSMLKTARMQGVSSRDRRKKKKSLIVQFNGYEN